MRVTFVKVGERRYGVNVQRDEAPAMTVPYGAPGYDDWLPHDLLHFVAEAEWQLDGAVFGRLAAGGDPGIFIPADPALIPKWMRRRRRAPKPHPKGRRSELLAGILDDAWKARRLGAPLPRGWAERLAAARADEPTLERALAVLDELAPRWRALQVGGSLTVEWPRPEGRKRRPPRARRRPQRPGAVRPR